MKLSIEEVNLIRSCLSYALPSISMNSISSPKLAEEYSRRKGEKFSKSSYSIKSFVTEHLLWFSDKIRFNGLDKQGVESQFEIDIDRKFDTIGVDPSCFFISRGDTTLEFEETSSGVKVTSIDESRVFLCQKDSLKFNDIIPQGLLVNDTKVLKLLSSIKSSPQESQGVTVLCKDNNFYALWALQDDQGPLLSLYSNIPCDDASIKISHGIVRAFSWVFTRLEGSIYLGENTCYFFSDKVKIKFNKENTTEQFSTNDLFDIISKYKVSTTSQDVKSLTKKLYKYQALYQAFTGNSEPIISLWDTLSLEYTSTDCYIKEGAKGTSCIYIDGKYISFLIKALSNFGIDKFGFTRDTREAISVGSDVNLTIILPVEQNYESRLKRPVFDTVAKSSCGPEFTNVIDSLKVFVPCTQSLHILNFDKEITSYYEKDEFHCVTQVPSIGDSVRVHVEFSVFTPYLKAIASLITGKLSFLVTTNSLKISSHNFESEVYYVHNTIAEITIPKLSNSNREVSRLQSLQNICKPIDGSMDMLSNIYSSGTHLYAGNKTAVVKVNQALPKELFSPLFSKISGTWNIQPDNFVITNSSIYSWPKTFNRVGSDYPWEHYDKFLLENSDLECEVGFEALVRAASLQVRQDEPFILCVAKTSYCIVRPSDLLMIDVKSSSLEMKSGSSCYALVPGVTFKKSLGAVFSFLQDAPLTVTLKIKKKTVCISCSDFDFLIQRGEYPNVTEETITRFISSWSKKEI